MYESFLTDVPSNTWWVDTGSMIHITNSLQGFHLRRILRKGEKTIRNGNGESVQVEAVGTLPLLLESGFTLYLNDVLYVPSMTRNLVSVSKLDDDGFSFMFGNKRIIIYHYSQVVGSGILEGKLYKLSLDNVFVESLITMNVNENIFSSGTKRKRGNENSSRLWHQRLGHISEDRMKRLIREGILRSLDFSDFNHCVQCIKGKFIKRNKKGATRSEKVFEIIHTDICGPFAPAIGGKSIS